MILTCKHCGKEFESSRSKRQFCSELCSNRNHAGRKREILASKDEKKVLSYGGGVDSTAIALLIIQGKLQRPDYIVMVDTGYEKASTWKYINEVVQPKLQAINLPITIIHTNDYSSNALIDKNGMVAIPAHRKNEDGTVSKMRTWCNGGWKSKVVNRWMGDNGLTKVESWIGFSADEERRKLKSDVRWIKYRYPLIELGLTRNDCIYELGGAGWPMPPRTSCYFCPQQTHQQWIHLYQREPQEFAKAKQIELEIQKTHPNVYLHASGMNIDEWIKTKIS